MSRLVEALDRAGESPRALKHNKLHICTWWAAAYVVQTLVDEHKTAYTIEEEVARWCARQPELRVEQIGTRWWRIEMKGGSGCQLM